MLITLQQSHITIHEYHSLHMIGSNTWVSKDKKRKPVNTAEIVYKKHSRI